MRRWLFLWLGCSLGQLGCLFGHDVNALQQIFYNAECDRQFFNGVSFDLVGRFIAHEPEAMEDSGCFVGDDFFGSDVVYLLLQVSSGGIPFFTHSFNDGANADAS